jgi:hypothetical protein
LGFHYSIRQIYQSLAYVDKCSEFIIQGNIAYRMKNYKR